MASLTLMGIDDWIQVYRQPATGRHALADDADTERARQLRVAWQRVARDGYELAALLQRAGVATQPAYVELTGRRDRVRLSVWLLSSYRRAKRVYVNNIDGRAMGTTMAPEVPGVALLLDGSLSQYRLVRRRPRLTVPLQQATPDDPPSHAVFAALAAGALGRR
jgi:hypothetical protein